MDTIVAPITPLVSAPVIVIRVSGDDAETAFSLMKKINGEPVSLPSPNVVGHYVFYAENGELTDDVLAVYFKAPASYTGEDVVEISFHGNPIIIAAALSSLYSLGFRDAMPGEFSKRAFLNGKMDLTQAEAVQELIAAKTEKGLHYAYEQLKGSVRWELDEMKKELLEIQAVIEAKIDFSEEETVEDENSIILEGIDSVLKRADSLLQSYRSLRSHREGMTIVLAGKPNVGKSSLLNSLLKEERAIVSNIPGTTRDYIKENLYIGGLPVQIIDTAGLRDAVDDIEVEGVIRSEAKVRAADIVLVVIDLSGFLDQDDAKVLELTENSNRIIIGNKSDEYKGTSFIPADIIVSAKTGHNMDKLMAMIRERAGMEDQERITGVVAVTERHAYALRLVVELLKSVKSNIHKMPLDMIAIDIGSCVSQFEEITGEKYTEEILDIVFSRFCIGK